MNDSRKEILMKIIKEWGKESQIIKIQEELLELALVINQRMCATKKPEDMEAQLYDELADVNIMLMQANLIFDADHIQERIDYKLNRVNQMYLMRNDEPDYDNIGREEMEAQDYEPPY